MGLMEYVLLTFFILIIIIVLIFFLVGFQITQIAAEKKESSADRALSILRHLSTSPLFVKEDGMLDDAKLTSLKQQDVCQELSRQFGENVFIEISVLDGEPQTPCSQSIYPQCNYWAFCRQEKSSVFFDLPINIYRNRGIVMSNGVLPQIGIGRAVAGIYE